MSPELDGSLKLSYKALGQHGSLKLRYKALELHGSLKPRYKAHSSSSPKEGTRSFNADLMENRNRLRGLPSVQVSL